MKNSIEEARHQPGGLNKAWRALREARKTGSNPNDPATQQARKAYRRAVRKHEEGRR